MDLLGILRIKDSNGNWVSVPGLKGDTGEPFKILGIYATAAALEAAVTDPGVGDVYLVGTTGAYDIYLYLADGWHNTGRYMPKGDQGDPAPQSAITSAVETWLAANVDPTTGYVLDRTLTQDDAAAPADLVGDLESALDTVQDATVEIVEPVNLVHGEWTRGYIINAQGVVTENSGYAYSDYFEVEPGTLICVTRKNTETSRIIMTETVAFYDADKTFIERQNGNIRTVPSNAKYARQNMQIAYLNSNYLPMVEKTDAEGTIASVYSDWFEPYTVLKANYGANFQTKNLCVFGDSLAANGNSGDNAWINIVGNTLGFKTVYNRGIGSTRVSATETRYAYVDAEGAAYMRASYTSQQTLPGYTEIDACLSSVDMANTIPADTDIIIIVAGNNDPSNVSAADFETAYKTMLDNIYARVPNARILIGTLPYNHNWDAGASAGVFNNFRQKIREIAALYGDPIIDFRADMMVNDLNWAKYMDTDGVHYNTKQAGKNRFAETAIPKVLNIKYL